MPFDNRGPHDIMFYTGGKVVRHTLADGDSVKLVTGSQSVLVRDVKILGPDQYVGIIYGFEPGPATEYNGLALGQRVEFREVNVFGFGEA